MLDRGLEAQFRDYNDCHPCSRHLSLAPFQIAQSSWMLRFLGTLSPVYLYVCLNTSRLLSFSVTVTTRSFSGSLPDCKQPHNVPHDYSFTFVFQVCFIQQLRTTVLIVLVVFSKFNQHTLSPRPISPQFALYRCCTSLCNLIFTVGSSLVQACHVLLHPLLRRTSRRALIFVLHRHTFLYTSHVLVYPLNHSPSPIHIKCA